jgi:hypothetical protein
MNGNDPLLTVRFDGVAVGSSKISVAHLLRFLTCMNKAMQRTGRVLLGEGQSVRRGSPERNVKDEVALDLVLLTHGSPAAVLGFERHQAESSFAVMDFGLEILEKTLSGLSKVQDRNESTLPTGYDVGVLMAWRDTGVLFNQGVTQISFTLKREGGPHTCTFTPSGFAHIQERIKGPEINIRTIEGRLLMADFKEHGTRCRVHPSVGEPVLCLFNENQKDEVFDDMLHFVRIVGEAKEDPATGKITSIKIHDIERLESKEDQSTDLLPKGTPISRDFWESPSLDELALAQNVSPLADVRALFGTWPGEVDDGFEMAVNEQRHAYIVKGN